MKGRTNILHVIGVVQKLLHQHFPRDVAKVCVELASVEVILGSVAFPMQRFTELVTMVPRLRGITQTASQSDGIHNSYCKGCQGVIYGIPSL